VYISDYTCYAQKYSLASAIFFCLSNNTCKSENAGCVERKWVVYYNGLDKRGKRSQARKAIISMQQSTEYLWRKTMVYRQVYNKLRVHPYQFCLSVIFLWAILLTGCTQPSSAPATVQPSAVANHTTATALGQSSDPTLAPKKIVTAYPTPAPLASCANFLPAAGNPEKLIRWVDCAIHSGDSSTLLKGVLTSDVSLSVANVSSGCENCIQKLSPSEVSNALITQGGSDDPGCVGYNVTSADNSLEVFYQGLSFAYTGLSSSRKEKFIGYNLFFVKDKSTPTGYRLDAIIGFVKFSGFQKSMVANACPVGVRSYITPVAPGRATCSGLGSQLDIGYKARVCTQKDRVIVRQEPRKDAAEIIGLQPGMLVEISSGPECVDNSVWWKVSQNGKELGWAREGRDETDLWFLCPEP
jgi:hypothetical protein